MTLRYGSVCSGIEAASVAWEPLGWKPAFFAEFDPEHNRASGKAFPEVLLSTRYPTVPNFGDMTRFEEWPDAAIDVLTGGTPCQSFSVAGLGEGLGDDRGNLMLIFGAVARRYRPKWLVWENVVGVLSNDDGRAFASLLGLLSGQRVTVPKDGWRTAGIVEGIPRAYGLAWRVLDAQYIRVDGFGRAVPQRRRRVFVVGCLGDWRRAAAVLLERASLFGDPPPRRQSKEDVAGTLAGGARSRGGFSYDDVPTVGQLAFGGNNRSGPIDVATALLSHGGPCGHIDFESETFIAHPLSAGMSKSAARMPHEQGALIPVQDVASGLDASYGRLQGASGQDLRDGYSMLVPIAFNGRQDPVPSADIIGAVDPDPYTQCVAFNSKDHGQDAAEGVSPTLRAAGGAHANDGAPPAITVGRWRVRRLTPLECERLQGFPDGWTNITVRGKPAADGPRYKALGNAMAVNCMRWLGRRIDLVRSL